MSTCKKCHRDISQGALFCAHCGASTAGTAETGQPSDPFLGKTLKGIYFIQQKIGDGGMGQVYKAVHVELDAPFAIKIVRSSLLSDPGVVGRFQREARAASRLHHPNVIAVTDFGQTEDGVLFMVMEHVAGKNLARIIADEAPLIERRVVHIGAQILAALSEAHANQILHRDLKPENVMVESRRDTQDSVKVLDFGIAKILMTEAPATTLTRAGLVVGTPGYMSPEQLTGDELDGRSDLYSVGVVLYEMLTGKLPFSPNTPVQMAHRQMTETPPPPSTKRARPVSPDLEALVMRALAPLRDDRPRSAEEMREQLLSNVIEDAPARGTPAAIIATVVMPRPRPTTAGAGQGPDRPDDPGPTARMEATPGGHDPQRPPPSSPGPGDGSIDPEELKTIEQRALQYLGPVAPLLVRKARAVAGNLPELVETIASFVPPGKQRTEFLTAFGRTRQTPGPGPARTPANVAWDQAELDRLQRLLALHIGPVARIVVQRASRVARDPLELREILAKEIASASDRKSFLASLGPPDSGPSG
jgi:serine/threonine-protein kinase